MVFYEKLHDPEDDAKYKPSAPYFNLTRTKLDYLVQRAIEIDKLASNNFEDFYGADELEQ